MLPPNLSLWGKLASGWLVEQSRERPFTQKFGHIHQSSFHLWSSPVHTPRPAQNTPSLGRDREYIVVVCLLIL